MSHLPGVERVFDEVIRTARGPRCARRVCYVAGSSLALAAGVLLAIWCGGSGSARVDLDPLFPVRIVGLTPVQGGGAPLSTPRAAGMEAQPTPEARPSSPRRREPPPSTHWRALDRSAPTALAPRLEEAEESDEHPALAGEEGSPGADAGSDPGAGSGASAGAGAGTGAGAGSDTGELASYPAAGWRRPEQAQRGCVQESVRIPSELRGFASGPIMVRFAIGRDGAPSEFEVLGSIPDARIGGAIWQAIRSCRWIPGADAQGRPMKIWVTMPLRFVSG